MGDTHPHNKRFLTYGLGEYALKKLLTRFLPGKKKIKRRPGKGKKIKLNSRSQMNTVCKEKKTKTNFVILWEFPYQNKNIFRDPNWHRLTVRILSCCTNCRIANCRIEKSFFLFSISNDLDNTFSLSCVYTHLSVCQYFKVLVYEYEDKKTQTKIE